MDPIVELVQQLEPETAAPSESVEARQRDALLRSMVTAGQARTRPARGRPPRHKRWLVVIAGAAAATVLAAILASGSSSPPRPSAATSIVLTAVRRALVNTGQDIEKVHSTLDGIHLAAHHGREHGDPQNHDSCRIPAGRGATHRTIVRSLAELSSARSSSTTREACASRPNKPDGRALPTRASGRRESPSDNMRTQAKPGTATLTNPSRRLRKHWRKIIARYCRSRVNRSPDHRSPIGVTRQRTSHAAPARHSMAGLVSERSTPRPNLPPIVARQGDPP
jgi:hypothetical protein